MRNPKKRDGKHTGKIASGMTVAGGLSTTGLAVAAGAENPGLAAASAALAFFPPLIAAYLPSVFDRRLKRVTQWWAWVLDLDGADKSIAAAIERRVQAEPEVQDVVMETLREVLDALSEEAVRPLALLAREYARDGRKRDRFFRGLVRMLREITGAELEQLKRLLTEVTHEDGERVQVEITFREPIELGITTVAEEEPPRRQRALAGEFPDIEDVFHLMKGHGLGSERTAGTWAMVSDADQLVIERSIAERILKYLS